MKISIKALDSNNEMYAEVIKDTLEHPTMMWIRRFIWKVVSCNEDKVRLDIDWTADQFTYSTHMEITHGEQWHLTYTEDEFFCDYTLEFDNKGELEKFIKDILKNLDDTDKAKEEWA